MKFQAKDIQKIVQIPKHRYEYIASKIGIIPDVNEVEGQGHTHIYSFKNLLQFAFVHYASGLGLTPKASRALLSFLDEIDQLPKIHFGIYEPDHFQDISVHYVSDEKSKYFCATFTFGGQEDRIKLEPVGKDWVIPGEKATFLYETIGFVTINIRNLKRKVVARIEE